MKKFRIFLTFLMVFNIFALNFNIKSFAADDTILRFNDDGKFKIIVFADCQDDNTPYQKMIDLIGDALDCEKPDLVVFTGDNVVVSSKSKFSTGAGYIIQPLIERGIPYAYTFGNHDDEYGVSKEEMHSIYMSLGNCLTYDAESSINGFGNCNIPIYSSDGENIAFNLWMIDSLTYADGGYDHVREDQLEWYKNKSIEIERQAGKKVNSLMFQHIALPEIYNLLTENSSGSKTYLGKKYSLNLNSNASGYLGEFPCPPAVNGGQFDALLERGDVLGVVTGHDHSNSFNGTYNGIGFLQMPGMSYQSYGDKNCRGYGVIELDEKDTSRYEMRTVSYIEFWNGEAVREAREIPKKIYAPQSIQYISEVKCAASSSQSSARSELTSAGYTVIDKDLNAGAGGNFIYMGYKTTSNSNEALRDIRFYVSAENESRTSVTLNINSVPCIYTKTDSIDLNKGAGGDYIYTYSSYDKNVGTPITAISFINTISSNDYVCPTLGSPYRVADLNANADGEYIYCRLEKLSDTVDITALEEKANIAREILTASTFCDNSDATLKDALNSANEIIADLENDGMTSSSQEYINSIIKSIDDGISLLKCRVDFVDYDGTILEIVIVPYKGSAVASIIPERVKDERNNYVFKAWDTDTSIVTTSMTVTALYDAAHYHSSDSPATCTEDETCRFCGETIAPATGHGNEVLRNNIQPSCTKDGYTGDYCCEKCGDVLTSGQVIPATGHSYGEWLYYIMPTVTKTGTDRLTCKICNSSIYRESPKATTATVNENFIYGFKANLSPDEVNSYFDERYLKVEKQSYNGRVMGTNSVISVTQKNVKTDYIVVIFGDVNSDGWYDGQDATIVACLADGMLSSEDVTSAEYLAADCNHDGAVDSLDVRLLNSAGLLLSQVDQSDFENAFESDSVYAEYLNLIDQTVHESNRETDISDNQQQAFDFWDIFIMWFEKLIALIVSVFI